MYTYEIYANRNGTFTFDQSLKARHEDDMFQKVEKLIGAFDHTTQHTADKRIYRVRPLIQGSNAPVYKITLTY